MLLSFPRTRPWHRYHTCQPHHQSLRNKSPRRPLGDVIGIEVRRDKPRPVTATCEGHRHRYKFAWADTPDGPVITDLRIVPIDEAPITRRDLARVPIERLAAAAKRHDTDEAAETWAGASRAFADAATHAGLPSTGYEWLAAYRPTEAGLIAATQRQGVQVPGRKPGRPRLPDEHYEVVALHARQAAYDGIRSIARYVQERMADAGTAGELATVQGWIKEAKRRGLIGPEELRRARRSRTTPPRGTQP